MEILRTCENCDNGKNPEFCEKNNAKEFGVCGNYCPTAKVLLMDIIAEMRECDDTLARIPIDDYADRLEEWMNDNLV